MTEQPDGSMERVTGLGRHGLAVAIISAIVGSTGGPFVLVKLGINPYRSDPATGTELRLMDARVKTLESHIGPEHPDRRQGYDARITANAMQIVAINTQLGTMSKNIGKMDGKLDTILDRLLQENR